MKTGRTSIKRVNGKLVAQVPYFVQPRKAPPTPEWIPARLNAVKLSDGRIQIDIYHHFLDELSCDVRYQPQIYIPRIGRTFIPYFAPTRWRIRIGRREAERLDLRPGMIDVDILCITIRWQIIIYHLGRGYTINTRTWEIPEITGSFMGRIVYPEQIFGYTVDSGYNVFAQWYYDEIIGQVSVDFLVEPNNAAMEKVISQRNNLAFRDITLRNYTTTIEIDYKFLCEIRVTHLSAYPQENYSIGREGYIKLTEAMKITIENIVNFWFQFKDEGSHIRYAEKQDKIDYITYGEEEKNPVSYGEVATFPFSKADKYVRIYAHGDEYEYDNDRISRDLNGKRLPDGRVVAVDGRGFIWLM